MSLTLLQGYSIINKICFVLIFETARDVNNDKPISYINYIWLA